MKKKPINQNFHQEIKTNSFDFFYHLTDFIPFSEPFDELNQ